jgi:hypothetical protein
MAKSQRYKRSTLSRCSLRIPERSWSRYECRRRVDDRVCEIESDLSGHMVVDDKELDAITRLLDDELEKLLSGIPGERE